MADQLTQIERASRLKRFLAPQIAEIILGDGDERGFSRATAATSPLCFAICAGSPRSQKPPSPRRSWRYCATITRAWVR